MLHCMILSGSVIFENPNGYLPGKRVGVRSKDPWTLGALVRAWDADTQSGYMAGYWNTFVIV